MIDLDQNERYINALYTLKQHTYDSVNALYVNLEMADSALVLAPDMSFFMRVSRAMPMFLYYCKYSNKVLPGLNYLELLLLTANSRRWFSFYGHRLFDRNPIGRIA